MWIEPASGFGGHDDLFGSLLPQPSQQPLATTVAVYVGRVEEINSTIHCLVQGGHGFQIIYISL
jgi:hypothetical protein